MVTEAMRSRFDRALADSQPHTALRQLAVSLKEEGVSQLLLYRLFAEYQLKTNGNDPRYDAIVDVMDLVQSGAWAKGEGLFDKELTDPRSE